MSVYQQSSTEQFSSEKGIFYHQNCHPNKLLVHIPALSKNQHYPNLFLASNARKPLKMATKCLLETTSKTPLNVGLENVLFVSTLQNYWTRSTTCRMKRHASSSGAQNHSSSVNAARRHSQPDANIPQQHHSAVEYASNPCSSSNSSSSSSSNISNIQAGQDARRLSFQSDAASTELIRRFSAESTTSSLSSISSFIFESHTKLYQQRQQQQQQQQQHKTPLSNDAQTGHPVGVAEMTSDLIIQKAAEAGQEQEQQDRDPGHACDTMQSPSKQMQQLQGTTPPIKQDGSKDQLPIWADPIRVKQNPTKFQYTKSYMKQRDITNDSSLPLAKPCVFHFSQTNAASFNKSEQYIAAVKPLFECDSVWNFAARWRMLKEKYDKKPSQLLQNQNLFCFVKGVEPMWEDPVNKDGGRLAITVHHSGSHLDDLFEWILCAFIGGILYEDGVVGIAVSKRHRGDRVELWLDQSANDDMMPVFKNKLCHLLASTCHEEIQSARYKRHFK